MLTVNTNRYMRLLFMKIAFADNTLKHNQETILFSSQLYDTRELHLHTQ